MVGSPFVPTVRIEAPVRTRMPRGGMPPARMPPASMPPSTGPPHRTVRSDLGKAPGSVAVPKRKPISSPFPGDRTPEDPTPGAVRPARLGLAGFLRNAIGRGGGVAIRPSRDLPVPTERLRSRRMRRVARGPPAATQVGSRGRAVTPAMDSRAVTAPADTNAAASGASAGVVAGEGFGSRGRAPGRRPMAWE